MTAAGGTDDGRLVKHSLVVAGHRTSISLENLFWCALRDIAARRGLSLAALVSDIDSSRDDANLSSALRVFVLRHALAECALASASKGFEPC